MRITTLLLLNIVILWSFGSLVRAEDSATAARPNIVFFIADDMQRYMFNCLAGDPQYAHILEDTKRELCQYLDDLPGGFAELKPDN